MAQKIILLTLLLACGTAQASEWQLVTADTRFTKKFFVDVSSIKVMGSVRHAWVKSVEVPHQVQAEEGKYVDYTIVRWAFNCAEATSKPDAGTEYYEDGTNLVRKDFHMTMKPVTPDSVNDTLMRFICAWKLK
jgi:hypothetical protein